MQNFKIQTSSMVEQQTVNLQVQGSSPWFGANLKNIMNITLNIDSDDDFWIPTKRNKLQQGVAFFQFPVVIKGSSSEECKTNLSKWLDQYLYWVEVKRGSSGSGKSTRYHTGNRFTMVEKLFERLHKSISPKSISFSTSYGNWSADWHLNLK